MSTATVLLSPAAERTAENFSGLSLQELIDVQAVYCNDYRLAQAAGAQQDAAAIYRHHIEPLGELIDSLDGTKRPLEEAECSCSNPYCQV